MEMLYEYFDKYYYSETKEEKEKIAEDFFERLWKNRPIYKRISMKDGYTCQRPDRKDDSFTFLKKYINFMYGKYCDEDVLKKYKKMSYSKEYFKAISRYYTKRIFSTYIPSEEYEKLHPRDEIDSFYDGFGDDSYVCAYFCKRFNGMMFNRRLRYYKTGWYGDCECGAQFKKNRINSAKKYCEACAKKNKTIQSMASKKRKYRKRPRKKKKWEGIIIGEVSSMQVE